MILPTKHEDLSSTGLIIGSSLIKKLKVKSLVIEDLYSFAREKHGISLSMFFDILTFLWLCGFVEVNNYEVQLMTGEYVS